MDKLWAPWRIRYLKKTKKSRKCIFCASAKKPTKDSFVIFKSQYSLSLLNIFPYNNGHCMVAPLRHVRELSELSDEETLDIIHALNRTQKLLTKTLRPHGYNIGINVAESAGAGIPDHIHIHIVPRWQGDTNFMPVIGDTKVISQSLFELHKALKHAHTKTD